jgi:hypothetical protein
MQTSPACVVKEGGLCSTKINLSNFHAEEHIPYCKNVEENMKPFRIVLPQHCKYKKKLAAEHTNPKS